MIVDSLAHITENGKWLAGDYDASAEALLRSMDRAGVDMAVLAGIPGKQDSHLVMAAHQQHPGRFIPAAGIHTGMKQQDIVAEVHKAADMGFQGIKIHPRLSNTPLLSQQTSTAIHTAASLDLTVLVCTIHRPPLPPLGRPLSDALQELCSNHADARIVLLHGGYFDLLATSEVVRPFEHVLLDLSSTLIRFQRSSLARDICFLLESFEKRIALGSDFPEGSMERAIEVLEGFGYQRQALNEMGVLGDNILRFFPNANQL